ncbi:MAG: hypothetical protein RLZZ12_89 [Actinomycetota bacterium]|jgi:hypothetical protein
MANDLFSALRTYLTKISSGEKTPQEVAAALNAWARESGEAIKVKIEEEVKKNVSRMGFAKASDLKRLEREVMELKSLLKNKSSGAKPKPKLDAKAKPKSKPKAKKKSSAKSAGKKS